MSAIHDVALHRAQPQLQLAVLVLQLHDDRVEELDLKVTTCKRAVETNNNSDSANILSYLTLCRFLLLLQPHNCRI